jgi:hypothetical protein
MPILINQGNQVTFIAEFFDSNGNTAFGFTDATLTVSYADISTKMPITDVLVLVPNGEVFTAAWGNSGLAAVGPATYSITAFGNNVLSTNPNLLITQRHVQPDPFL